MTVEVLAEEWLDKERNLIIEDFLTEEEDDFLSNIFKKIKRAYINGYHKCQKEHEWHYVKDGNPDNENDILCQISKDEVEVGYYHTKQKRYYTIDGQPIDVIRWQEIVFPKESE